MPLMSASKFWARIETGLPILSDGAMGSELIGQGIAAEDVFSAALDAEAKVRAIHEAYISSGSDLISSNTFGLQFTHSRWPAAVKRAIELANETARVSAREIGVWLSLPGNLDIVGWERLKSLLQQLRDRSNLVLIETCTDIDQARIITRTVLDLKPDVLAVTAHFRADGLMPDGTSPERFAAALQEAGAHIVGGNCGDLPETFTGIVERMKAVVTVPILIQPSAGVPGRDSVGGWSYPVAPTRFALVTTRLMEAGAQIVGGCCGASPAHIAAVFEEMRHARGRC